MAIGWLSMLKTVPWVDVISNAPKVADGAKKLWNSVGNRAAVPAADVAAPQSAAGSQAEGMVELQARVSNLEAAAGELHEQMRESSEVIKALAEQNAQLIRNLDLQRSRMAWLWGALVFVGIIAMAALALALVR